MMNTSHRGSKKNPNYNNNNSTLGGALEMEMIDDSYHSRFENKNEGSGRGRGIVDDEEWTSLVDETDDDEHQLSSRSRGKRVFVNKQLSRQHSRQSNGGDGSGGGNNKSTRQTWTLALTVCILMIMYVAYRKTITTSNDVVPIIIPPGGEQESSSSGAEDDDERTGGEIFDDNNNNNVVPQQTTKTTTTTTPEGEDDDDGDDYDDDDDDEGSSADEASVAAGDQGEDSVIDSNPDAAEDDHAEDDGTDVDDESTITTTTEDDESSSTAADGNNEEDADDDDDDNKVDYGAFRYSQMATIIPDPFHPVGNNGDDDDDDEESEDTDDDMIEKYGKWNFYDGDEDERADYDYCADYPNRDIPSDEFPDDSWQVDAVYVNHFINDAELLVSRAMEAIFAEYGHGQPLSALELGERLKMFHWEKVDLDNDPNAGLPPKYQKEENGGDRGNGGWTTERSFDGLVRRLLHSIITNDKFVVVLAGHSAAAGHGNFFHQSYIMQFHSIMEPIFARLGVQLITRNIAQGGLGTIQNSIGSKALYGNDIDLLLWDSEMTENQTEHIDLFYRQALLGNGKIPVLWGGHYDTLRQLYIEADVDIGDFGYGTDGIIEVTSREQAEDEVPYAARYMKCANDVEELCKQKEEEERFCATCWLDRDDIADPNKLFPNLSLNKVKSQVSWHPGWRKHQLIGRVLAFAVLDALQVAIQIFSENTMGGPPLDEEFWHVTEYYNNIRTKIQNLDRDIGYCYNLPKELHPVCSLSMNARSLFTPRYNPIQTSISTLLKPATITITTAESSESLYLPTNNEKLMYDGPDVHNPCDDLPDDAVDVLAIISNRRMMKLRRSGRYNSNRNTRRGNQRHLQQVRLDDNEEQEQARMAMKTTTLSRLENKDRLTTRNNTATSTFLLRRHGRSMAADNTDPDSDVIITPGLGWEINKENPGQCDGEYYSICGRKRADDCPALGHHDSRGILVGNEYSGWVVMDIPNVRHGYILLKFETWHKPEQNPRAANWNSVNNIDNISNKKSVNNDRRRQHSRRQQEHELEHEREQREQGANSAEDEQLLKKTNDAEFWDEYYDYYPHNNFRGINNDSNNNNNVNNSTMGTNTNDITSRGLGLEDLPETFQFEYAIDGKVTTLSKEQFIDLRLDVQRVVEIFPIMDETDKDNIEDYNGEGRTVEVAFRMLGCANQCTFGLTHVYWA